MEKDRRSGVDRRCHQRRQNNEDFSRLYKEIDDKNTEIKKLTDEIKEINKQHHVQ